MLQCALRGVRSVTALSVLLLLSSDNLLDTKSKLRQSVPVLLESDHSNPEPQVTHWQEPSILTSTKVFISHHRHKRQKNPSPRKRRHNPRKEKEDRATQRQEGKERKSKVGTNPHLAC